MVKKMSQKPMKWNPQITTAIRNSRKVWGDWKNAGRPSKDENATLHDKMRDAKTNLRKLTRQANARDREVKLQNIMDNENNTKSFHALVRQQRKSNSNQTTSLAVDGVICESPKEICDGWTNHFKTLATPKLNQNWNLEYSSTIENDLIHIENICTLQNSQIQPVSQSEIKKMP